MTTLQITNPQIEEFMQKQFAGDMQKATEFLIGLIEKEIIRLNIQSGVKEIKEKKPSAGSLRDLISQYKD